MFEKLRVVYSYDPEQYIWLIGIILQFIAYFILIHLTKYSNSRKPKLCIWDIKDKDYVTFSDCNKILNAAQIVPQKVKDIIITYDGINKVYLFHTNDELVKTIKTSDMRYRSTIQMFLSNEVSNILKK